MTNFKHIHSSSRYDRSVASLANAAKAYAASGAHIITWTEVERESREQAIRNALPGWRFVSGDMSYANDCAISFDKDRFGLLFSENFKSTDVPFYDKGGKKKHPQWATNAVLFDRTNNKRLVVVVIHLASGIEGALAAESRAAVGKRKFRFKGTTKAAKNWYASFRGAKKRANYLKKKFKAQGIVFVADWNIDLKTQWARTLVKTLAPLYLLTWRNVNVRGGTHGNRIIDGTILAGNIGVTKRGAVLFKDDNSSDHRPYVETLTWV